MTMEISNRGLGTYILFFASMMVLAFLLAPLLIVVAISFTESNYLAFPPTGFTFKWYQDVLDNPFYISAFWLSIKIALSSMLVAVCLGVPASIVLKRKTFFGSRVISGLFLSPLILPTIVLGVVILQYTSALGYGMTFPALLVGHIVLIIPYIMRATLVSLANYDLSFEEAAQDLGATTFETFRFITLPQIKPGIIAGALFGFVISWINVEVSIFNSTSAQATLPVRIFNQVQMAVDPTMAAISALTIYFAIITVLALDYFIGIEKTGMK